MIKNRVELGNHEVYRCDDLVEIASFGESWVGLSEPEALHLRDWLCEQFGHPIYPGGQVKRGPCGVRYHNNECNCEGSGGDR